MSDPTSDPDFGPEREKPEMLRLKSILPSLTVSDLQASLAWYSEVVGFHVAETHEHDGEVRGAELVAGVVRFMLFQDDWAKGRDRQKGEGFRLYLEASQDVDQVALAIKQRGGILASEPADMPWGKRAFDLVDPDGFNLTVTG